MKELMRMGAYIVATLAMIGIVVGVGQMDLPEGSLAIAAIVIVVVLPVIIAVFMGKREKRNAEPS